MFRDRPPGDAQGLHPYLHKVVSCIYSWTVHFDHNFCREHVPKNPPASSGQMPRNPTQEDGSNPSVPGASDDKNPFII